TNDVATLAPGRGVYAGYLTPNGRMLADIILIDREDTVMGLVGEGQGPAVATRLDQLIFTEDVQVADVTPVFDEVFVTGGLAAAVVGQAVGLAGAELGALDELGNVPFAGGFVLREGASTLPAYRIVFEAGAAGQIQQGLAAAGAIELEQELVTALRIEAGRARWGSELGEDVIPLEAGLLDRAVSTTKGCYVGQEIVIRILHRGGGRVAKRLVTMAFDPSLAEAPTPKGELTSADAVVGHLTSVAFSPARGAFVALGYLRREAAEVGREVTVAGTDATARVTGFAS